eukprot:1195728-Prorocentrum_minimum.AAC.7
MTVYRLLDAMSRSVNPLKHAKGGCVCTIRRASLDARKISSVRSDLDPDPTDGLLPSTLAPLTTARPLVAAAAAAAAAVGAALAPSSSPAPSPLCVLTAFIASDAPGNVNSEN